MGAFTRRFGGSDTVPEQMDAVAAESAAA